MRRLKQLHIGLGLLGVFLFILSGQYMHFFQNHLADLNDGPRMLFRSGHIYFLLCCVLNLLVGFYMQLDHINTFPRTQYVISTLLLLAPVFITCGFFIEPFLKDLHRPYTVWGLYGVFVVALIVAALQLKHYIQRK